MEYTQHTAAVPAPQPGVRELVDRLVRFDGPPDQFLRELLAAQCHFARVTAGAVIRFTDAEHVEVLASHPSLREHDTPPVWLAQAVQLLRENPGTVDTAVHPLGRPDELYGQNAAEHLILLPTRGLTSLDGVEAFLVQEGDPAAVQERRQRLELSLALLTLYEMRRTLAQRDGDLQGLATATGILAVSNEQSRFRAASLAFCNELATRFSAERASFGVLAGRYVKLRAMSQTEHVNRKMAVVRQIESVMEEALDQDTEVFYPASSEVGFVNRSAEELARRDRAGSVCSLPIRRAGEPVAVVTIEKDAGQPFSPAEFEFLRMACDLCGPRLLERSAQDRWVGARIAGSVRHGLGVVLGPTHTWAKATALGLIAAVLCLAFIRVPYRVDAPFTFESVTQRSIPAPFDGFINEVFVEPGDTVAAGDVLATLNTEELSYEKAKLSAEQLTYRKQADVARREGKTVDVQIAEAQAQEAQARIALLEYQIDRARLTAPFDGQIITGDLKQQLGAPVQRGDVLFEIAPPENLRAVMLVSDTDIPDIAEGMAGQLAAASYPGDKLRFVVEHINPIAEVIDQDNAFRVKLALQDRRPWARPGIEGVAKIDAGRASLGWVWTRDAVNWLRLKLWM